VVYAASFCACFLLSLIVPVFFTAMHIGTKTQILSYEVRRMVMQYMHKQWEIEDGPTRPYMR